MEEWLTMELIWKWTGWWQLKTHSDQWDSVLLRTAWVCSQSCPTRWRNSFHAQNKCKKQLRIFQNTSVTRQSFQWLNSKGIQPNSIQKRNTVTETGKKKNPSKLSKFSNIEECHAVRWHGYYLSKQEGLVFPNHIRVTDDYRGSDLVSSGWFSIYSFSMFSTPSGNFSTRNPLHLHRH